MILKKTLIKLLGIGVFIKVKLQRATTYMAIMNSALLLYFFITQIQKDKGIELSNYLLPLIFVGVFLIMIFLGWFEDKVGIMKGEIGEFAKRNAYLIKIMKITISNQNELKEIKQILKEQDEMDR